MTHLLFLVVNNKGSLSYSREMNKGMPNSKQYDDNELITLASTFHSIHAIAAEITPSSESAADKQNMFESPVLPGIESVVADTFVLKCM